jgi:co-chaperonin GroES (HSP10)
MLSVDKGDKMTLTPVNNYLTVQTVEDTDTEDSGILLPQDYRAVESPFAVVEVVNCSGDSGTLWGAGLQIVVEAHMLRDIQHNGETYTVIKENHVIGILTDS